MSCRTHARLQSDRLLHAGDLVWLKAPGYGFVSVGRARSGPVPAADFKLTDDQGHEQPAMELLAKASYHREIIDDPNARSSSSLWIGPKPSRERLDRISDRPLLRSAITAAHRRNSIIGDRGRLRASYLRRRRWGASTSNAGGSVGIVVSAPRTIRTVESSLLPFLALLPSGIVALRPRYLLTPTLHLLTNARTWANSHLSRAARHSQRRATDPSSCATSLCSSPIQGRGRA
jgi:hypothetical protein